MASATILVVEDHPLNREFVVDLFAGISEQHHPHLPSHIGLLVIGPVRRALDRG